MNTIRWGIIGCGNVTEVKSGPAFYKCPGSALVAVMRRDAEKAADYARRHGVSAWYTDADPLINDKNVDAVYIATPPGTHEFYAAKVLAAGKPCYVEKPMSRNAAEAIRMVQGFQTHGVPLFVAYYRRQLPRFMKVRELIHNGTLGPIQSVLYSYADQRQAHPENPPHWHVNAEQSGGGNFLDLMPHVLDLLDWWLEPLTLLASLVTNSVRAYPVEDCVVATMVVRDLPICLKADFTGQLPPQDQFLIQGERARLQLSCFGNEPLQLVHNDGSTELFDLPTPPHVAMPLIQTIVDELLGIGKCPSTGETALRTQILMDQILNEYYGGREDNFWTRPWPGYASTPSNHK